MRDAQARVRESAWRWGEKTVQGVAEEETLPFPPKREGECKKTERFRRKVHKFLQCVLMNGKFETFSSKKRLHFETKEA